jgi:signal transduction histidine kinase
MEFVRKFFDTTMFSPHGICLLWEPQILLVHVVSDALIAIAYFSIPVALTIFVRKRSDVDFGWLFWAFAIFIFACGLTHVLSIYTLWVPIYGVEGVVKFLTALASVFTAILLWPLLPKLLQIPSPSQLRHAHVLLEAEAQQRKEAEHMLRQAQKMEAVGQLTGGVAHDFNNLLMVILGNLELGRREVMDWTNRSQEKVFRYLDSARDGAKKAAKLTERLLAFSRRQPLDPKPIRPNELIAGMSDLLQRAVGENIEIQIVGAAGLWITEVDTVQLESALLNLVINARDAMPRGGKLTIETANAFIDEQYSAANADVAVGQYVLISVTDNGEGMDTSTAERAFEPFFSTKEAGHGTGLGLSQVYGFVKQSGGHAKIYSELSHGTTVKLYLPRLADDVPTITARSEIASLAFGKGEGILVVEDDGDVRSYVCETLSKLNYRTFAAQSADEAEALFKREASQIALLLTDVVMPGGNGRELSSNLLKVKPSLQVLFMTGYSRNAIVHQGRLDKGVDFLQKPVTQAMLASKIRSLLDR